jgi:hypothetical protein
LDLISKEQKFRKNRKHGSQHTKKNDGAIRKRERRSIFDLQKAGKVEWCS